eukprot:g31034.t1
MAFESSVRIGARSRGDSIPCGPDVTSRWTFLPLLRKHMASLTAAPLDLESCVASFCQFASDEEQEAEAKRALNYVLVEVQRGRLQLKDLVKALGSYLTHSEPAIRKRGLLLLAEVLIRLPKLRLNTSSLDTLLTFFIGRTEDYPCAAEVLKALLALAQHHRLPEGKTAFIVQRVFASITIQSLPQPARKDAYDLLWAFMQNPTTSRELERMPKGAFAVGLVAAMDGEKDPRNLLTCFQLVSSVLSRFSKESISSELCNELFDVTSCYFPITFTPPPNDIFGITGDQLKRGLLEVFTSTSSLASFVLPFLLDKVESLDEAIKLDSLEALQECLLCYELQALVPFFPTCGIAFGKLYRSLGG